MKVRCNRYLNTKLKYLCQKTMNLHMNLQANLHMNLHPSDPWDRYGVIWAKQAFKGFDLLVPATNNKPGVRPARGGHHE